MEDSDYAASTEAIGHLSMMADAAHIMANMHTMEANKLTDAGATHLGAPQAPTQEFVEKNNQTQPDKQVLDGSPIGLETPDVVDSLRSASAELETHVGLRTPDPVRPEPISFHADDDIISDTPIPLNTDLKEDNVKDDDSIPVPFHIDDKDDVPVTLNRNDATLNQDVAGDKRAESEQVAASHPVSKAEYFDVSEDELPDTNQVQEKRNEESMDGESSNKDQTSPTSQMDTDQATQSYTSSSEPYVDTRSQAKVTESLSLGPDGKLIHETKGSSDSTLAFPRSDEQVGKTAANLLLSIANTEPVVKVERTEEDDLSADMMADIVEQHKNAQEEDGEAFTLVDVEAGPPFRMDICKAMESVCRRVFQATKFIRITGDLHFSVDDVETVRMPDVSHTIEVVKVYRSKRGRPRKTPSLFTAPVNYSELSEPEDELPRGKRVAVARNAETPQETLYQCEHCDYSTRHAGFYKKHMRVKHTEPKEGPSKSPKVPRKRGRPKKNTPKKKLIRRIVDSDEEDNQIVEDDHMESGSEGGDNDAKDTTYRPNSDKPDDETTPTRATRSSGPSKYKCDQCTYETDHSGHYRDHLNRHAGVKPHQCPQCPKSFIRLDDLKKHAVVHDRKWECATCGTELEDKAGLAQHMKDVHNEMGPLQLLNCHICKTKFPTQAELTKHMDTKHNHICGICGENFTYLKQMQKHKREVHPRECLTCTICMKACVSKGALRKHMHKHRHGSAFPCDICQRIFTTQSSLYHHKRGVHHNLRAYKCTQCEKSFNFHHSLKLHMLKHQGLRPYKCEVCEKTYLTATHLKSHVNAVHSDTKKFPCPICNKRFPYENSLRQHMMLHTGDRPFLCNICGRGFTNNSALKTHEASHVDSKDWQCDICKKMYKTEALMRAHQRRHTEQGSRFMCDICGHTFMYKSNLEAHSTVHSGERNYTCKECGCTFKTAATLYSHRLVHKTETPHNCVICGKAFKSKERKLAHEKRHMGDKPFQCEVCGRAFPDKGGLSKHTKTVHSRVKRFVCPVCKKTCSRADNLRVHMRIHRDPDLLKMDWKALMTNDVEDGSDNMEYFSSSQQVGPAQGPQMGHQVGSESTNSQGSMPPMSGTNTQVSSSHGHLQMTGSTPSHHTSRDSLQPFDLRQPPNIQQPADLRQNTQQNAPHQHRHPGHHLGPQGPHHPGVLVVPEPNLPHHLHSSYQTGMAGSSAQHIAAAMSALLPPGHGLPPPPPAHHQHSGGLQPSSSQDYDNVSQDNMRTIQVILPPAAHSGTEDSGGQSSHGQISHGQISHAMRDYAEHAMLFMQYQSNTHHQ